MICEYFSTIVHEAPVESMQTVRGSVSITAAYFVITQLPVLSCVKNPSMSLLEFTCQRTVKIPFLKLNKSKGDLIAFPSFRDIIVQFGRPLHKLVQDQ